jgi:hypothetical protein
MWQKVSIGERNVWLQKLLNACQLEKQALLRGKRWIVRHGLAPSFVPVSGSGDRVSAWRKLARPIFHSSMAVMLASRGDEGAIRLENLPSVVAVGLRLRHQAVLNPRVQACDVVLIFMAWAVHFGAKEMLIRVDEFIHLHKEHHRAILDAP